MEVGTNEARMVRQQQYLSQLMDLLHAKILESSEFVGTLFDELSPYLESSLSRERMITEVWNSRNYERLPVTKLDGSHTEGADGHIEFYVDNDSLVQAVLDLFYQKTK
jgi:anionic cell wall polymer biosynthesis LytR-Cps2A-Psr (LCP) family protein